MLLVQIFIVIGSNYSFGMKFNIFFIGKSIPNDFVVGYGLDYDAIGRNLPHIYKLKNE